MIRYIALRLTGFLILVFTHAGYAISVEELNNKLGSGEKLTIIDVRANALYQQAHIHNAINIPASLVERKKLPQLGMVIVYGDGVDEEITDRAIEHLNSKPGIEADKLEGGFSSWSSKHNVVQREKGLTHSQTKNITYKKLQKMAGKGRSIVLVDLRVGDKQESLSEHFPDIQIHDPLNSKKNTDKVNSTVLAGIPKRNRKVIVLIDDGNGFSEKVADKLNASGTKRIAILSGGEKALRARGAITEEVRRSAGR